MGDIEHPVGDDGREAAAIDHCLYSIWDDDMLSKFTADDGVKKWKCLWCSLVFSTWNGTKVLAHVRKYRRQEIKICTARIDEAHQQQYNELHNTQQRKRKANNGVRDNVENSISNHNLNVASQLDSQKKRHTSGIIVDHFNNPEVETPRLATRGSVAGLQLTLGSSGKDGVSGPSADSQLTIAIADLIHSRGLPFNLSSDPKFRKVLVLAKNVTLKYRPPGRNQVATDLLDLNYDAYMKKNMSLVQKEAIWCIIFWRWSNHAKDAFCKHTLL